jgi:NADH:ubiquinone oxidoreductase subunit 4 (subunit M)
MNILLTAALLVPLVSGGAIAMSKNGIAIPSLGLGWFPAMQKVLGGKTLSNKQLGLLGSTVSLGLITILIYTFNSSQLGYQFNIVNPNNFLNAFTLNIGIDGLSIFFVLLTAFILPLAILSNWKSIPESNDKTYTVLMLILETLLLTIFLVLDILGFYIFFESILAPLYILIGIYGSANKEKAAYFLLLFTLAGSLIMLLGIGTIYDVTNSTSFNVLFNVVMSIKLQSILWIAIFVAVMVKTPVFPLHTWLPVVHSESPLGGSIILAGIILKLAVYSCIRILIPIFAEGTFLFVPLIFVIGILTIIYTSLVTTRQMDVKVIIAYSSIGRLGPFHLLKNLIMESQQTICGKFIILKNYIQNTNRLDPITIGTRGTESVNTGHTRLYTPSLSGGNTMSKNFCSSNLSLPWAGSRSEEWFGLNNPQITKALSDLTACLAGLRDNLISMLVVISEAICLLSKYTLSAACMRFKLKTNINYSRYYSTSKKKRIVNEKRYNEWLAGLIDGDGYFYSNKSGSSGLEITMDLRDEHCLYLVKNRFGGSVKLRSGVSAVRYRLHNKEGLSDLINSKPLEYDDGWLSGFFDSDGSIYLYASGTTDNVRLTISISQKNKLLLDPLMELYGGTIHSHSKSGGAFKWSINNKEAILSLLNNYFHNNPSRSYKMNRLNLIPKVYELKDLRAYSATQNSILAKAWLILMNKWNKGLERSSF